MSNIMIDYAKQSHFAEKAANMLRRELDERRLALKFNEERYELERAKHIMFYASPEDQKAMGSSSTVAMKRKATEGFVLDNYPFSFDTDLDAERFALVTLETQMRDARNDATLNRMLFLAHLRGFNDMDEKPWTTEQIIEDDMLLIGDQINAAFQNAEEEYG